MDAHARNTRGWVISTIARRVSFLERIIADPITAKRFQRRVALFKWMLVLGIAAVISVLVRLNGWN